MTFSAVLTVITDVLIAMTLVYCIVLERRIRAFRKQEQAFRTLMGDVAESTRVAQGAVVSLRRLLDDLGSRTLPRASHEQVPLGTSQPSATKDPVLAAMGDAAGSAQTQYARFDNPVSALASRVVALRNQRVLR